MENFTPQHFREKGLFALFGQAGVLYFKSAKFLAVMTILSFLPVFVFRLFLPAHLAYAFAEFQALLQYYLAGGEIYMASLMAAAEGDATIYTFMHAGVWLAFLPLMVGATTYLAARHLDGESPNFSDMLANAMPRFPAMLATLAIVAVIMVGLLFLTGGTFLVAIPIYIAVTIMFFMHVTADVGRWGFNALSISRFLVRGRWFRVLFFALFILVAYGAVYLAINVFGGILGVSASLFAELPFFLISQLILSYFLLVFALWYFDIKTLHQRNLEAVEKMVSDTLREIMERRDNDDSKL
ncbi:MAG: hypothetical protein FWE21_04650 [Defluviitaleaceae bacterium]|nr:hypothetical protein [Defluviitaleaceae bacterium]